MCSCKRLMMCIGDMKNMDDPVISDEGDNIFKAY